MATVILKIRQDLVKKSAGAPTAIYVQCCAKDPRDPKKFKVKLFNTGKKIDPDFWDEEGQCVKNKYRGYTTINAVI